MGDRGGGKGKGGGRGVSERGDREGEEEGERRKIGWRGMEEEAEEKERASNRQ